MQPVPIWKRWLPDKGAIREQGQACPGFRPHGQLAAPPEVAPWQHHRRSGPGSFQSRPSAGLGMKIHGPPH